MSLLILTDQTQLRARKSGSSDYSKS